MLNSLKRFVCNTTLASALLLVATTASATDCEATFVDTKTAAELTTGNPAAEAVTLGQLLGLDAQLGRFVEQPEVMTYIFLRFFEPKATDRDLSDTLAKMAVQDGKSDLYDIFTKQIETKLQDIATAEKVRSYFQAEGYFNRKHSRPGFWEPFFVYQFKHLPQSVRRMKEIIATDLAFTKMDRRTFDFMGALHFGWKESSLRAWNPV